VEWPKGTYDCILADPPWQYRVYYKSDAAHGAAEAHYPTMKLDEIKALPVVDIAAKDCALFLWVTMPCLQEGLEVLKAWGFRYKTMAFTWVKLNRDGTPWFGLGHWTRGNPELCLLGTRGKVKRIARNVPQLIMSQRQEHSRKPKEQYERIARLIEPKNPIELFARRKERGWDVWGNEV